MLREGCPSHCACCSQARLRADGRACTAAHSESISEPYAHPQAIRVEPVVQDREAPELRIGNCESIENMRETLVSRVPVEVSATVAETAITAEGSHASALPPDLRKQLEGLVRRAYQDVYSEALAGLMKTELIVRGETTMVYRLRQSEQRYAGQVSFFWNDQAHTVGYDHVLAVPYVDGLASAECIA